MKYKIYAYVQLVILVFYFIRPVLPYIEYTVNKAYIIKNLCINRYDPNSSCEGKCYMEKEIRKGNDSNEQKDTNSNKRVKYENVKEFINPYKATGKVFVANIVNITFQKPPVPSSPVATIFVPPKIEFLL